MQKKTRRRNKIAILDDDSDLLEFLELILNRDGYQTVTLSNSNNFKNLISNNDFSLYIIDRNLPCIEGTKLVEQIRVDGDKTPVIFLTAKNSRDEKIEGFQSGGDDYITKPFDRDEFLLRVEAVIRRTYGESYNQILSFRDIYLDVYKFEVSIANIIINLTKLEFKLLQTFIENKNNVIDRDYLLEVVWNCTVLDDRCNEKSINVAIKRLKSKIDPDGSKDYIEAVRGIGYKLKLKV